MDGLGYLEYRLLKGLMEFHMTSKKTLFSCLALFPQSVKFKTSLFRNLFQSNGNRYCVPLATIIHRYYAGQRVGSNPLSGLRGLSQFNLKEESSPFSTERVPILF